MEEEEDFFEDLFDTDIGWHPHLKNMTCDDEFYELKIKDRHVIRIEFMDSQIPRMPDSIANLTHLEEVELHHNWFEKFPIEIFTIPNLKKLVSSDNRYLQIEFGNSTSLQKLTISDTIDFLPESIGRLSNLTDLHLSRTRLTTLPESIGKLTNLTNLSLFNNKLTILPNSIKNLKKLRYLDLRSNYLTTLPKAIGSLTSLKELVIRENNISSLPDSLGGCSSLRVIMAQKNKLSTIPATLSNLKQLRVLNLANNPITTLPEELAQLENLEGISLNFCKLKELPIAITKFRSLEALRLNTNYLTTLPDSIKNLTSLKVLSLNNNKFTKLPEELKLLPSLNYIDLQYNPLPRKFLRTFKGASIRIMLMSDSLKNVVDIENALIEAIEQDLSNVFTALINSGILNNINEAITKKIVLKAFKKGDLFLVRYLLKKGFALLFKEGELNKFIIDKNASLRKALASCFVGDYHAIPIVRYFLTNLNVSRDQIKDLLTKLGIG